MLECLLNVILIILQLKWVELSHIGGTGGERENGPSQCSVSLCHSAIAVVLPNLLQKVWRSGKNNLHHHFPDTLPESNVICCNQK